MNGIAWQVLVVALSGSLALRAQDEEKLVSGRVVDMKGRPVAKTLSRGNMFEELERAMGSGR